MLFSLFEHLSTDERMVGLRKDKGAVLHAASMFKDLDCLVVPKLKGEPVSGLGDYRTARVILVKDGCDFSRALLGVFVAQYLEHSILDTGVFIVLNGRVKFCKVKFLFDKTSVHFLSELSIQRRVRFPLVLSDSSFIDSPCKLLIVFCLKFQENLSPEKLIHNFHGL
jgi:hypothetical protein